MLTVQRLTGFSVRLVVRGAGCSIDVMYSTPMMKGEVRVAGGLSLGTAMRVRAELLHNPCGWLIIDGPDIRFVEDGLSDT